MLYKNISMADKPARYLCM